MPKDAPCRVGGMELKDRKSRVDLEQPGSENGGGAKMPLKDKGESLDRRGKEGEERNNPAALNASSGQQQLQLSFVARLIPGEAFARIE